MAWTSNLAMRRCHIDRLAWSPAQQASNCKASSWIARRVCIDKWGSCFSNLISVTWRDGLYATKESLLQSHLYGSPCCNDVLQKLCRSQALRPTDVAIVQRQPPVRTLVELSGGFGWQEGVHDARRYSARYYAPLRALECSWSR